MTVLFYGDIQKYTLGEKSFKATYVPNISVLINELGKHFGERFKEFLQSDGNCFFLINGKGITTTGGLFTPLQADDIIEILPVVEAG